MYQKVKYQRGIREGYEMMVEIDSYTIEQYALRYLKVN